MKIAVCDDNKNELFIINKILEEFIASQFPNNKITYTAFQSSIDLLNAIECGQYFDILLLDIVMPLMNGIQLADEIRTKNISSKIIFLTSSSEYAIDSYSVGAYYYLLKPIKKETLVSLLKKISFEFFNDIEKYLFIKNTTTLSKIALSQLEYVEVINRTLFFHLINGEILKSTFLTISELEKELLINKQFAKPHRSYIINMDHIRNLSSNGITTIGGASIPISRNLYKGIKQQYIDYSFE